MNTQRLILPGNEQPNIEDDYYKNFYRSKQLLNEMRTDKIDEKTINRMLIEHMVETMTKEDEIKLLNYIFKNPETLDDFEKLYMIIIQAK